MTIKSGWDFPKEFGFTGSRGSKPVKGYMRGGSVKSERREPRMAKGGHHEGRHMSNGGEHKPKLGSGERFAALKGKLSHEKGVKNPGALAAAIGRKKYGEKKMASMSAKGRKRMAIGGLVTESEYAPPSRETVKPGGAQQFARGGHVVSFYARGGRVKVPAGHVIKGGKNNVGLPKKAPDPFPVSDEKGNEVRPGGRLQFARGGGVGMETLGKDRSTPGGGKWADFKRGGKMHKRGGGRC
jgi:hypothetical protein